MTYIYIYIYMKRLSDIQVFQILATDNGRQTQIMMCT